MKPHAKTALTLALAIVGGIAAGMRCDASVTVETPTQINPRVAAYTVKTYTEGSDPFIPSISTEIGPNEGLVWRYINTPRNNCKADMQMHHGVSRATINNVGELECDYYNCSRERNTCGTIKFRKRV